MIHKCLQSRNESTFNERERGREIGREKNGEIGRQKGKRERYRETKR